MAESIRILIVDDHEMVRMGLHTFLMTEEGLEVVGEAKDGKEAFELVRELLPDVVLMDLVMDGQNGIEATAKIHQWVQAQNQNIRVLVLTSYLDHEMIIPVLEAGASGYILKTSSAQEIARAIRRCYGGESVIEGQVATMMLQHMRNAHPKHEELTQRELEVLGLLGQGKNNKEIGEILHIGLKTVKTHVSNILAKLELEDRTNAAIYANKHNLV